MDVLIPCKNLCCAPYLIHMIRFLLANRMWNRLMFLLCPGMSLWHNQAVFWQSKMLYFTACGWSVVLYLVVPIDSLIEFINLYAGGKFISAELYFDKCPSFWISPVSPLRCIQSRHKRLCHSCCFWSGGGNEEGL